MISFNVPPFVGDEFTYIRDAVEKRKICGDGQYTKLCNKWLEDQSGVSKALLTTSCTHATEMAAILIDIKPGDEVIMPSFTFVSTANAFVLRGAKVVFVDIRPDTMNMDEKLIEAAITEKTKAIVPVHYAGVSCEMDEIMSLAEKYNLKVIEDAAQAITSEYKGKPCGSIGNFGCYSFHETKNISMGEGGALLIRDSEDVSNAEIIREKGTNRSAFFRGEIGKYTWVLPGSSYLPSELNAAYLWAQLQHSEEIINDRMSSWNYYYNALSELKDQGKIELPTIPEHCKHNAHMFYIKTKDFDERADLIAFLRERDVNAVFHYIPLHSSPAGVKYSTFHGEDRYTTVESRRLLRLPLWYGMGDLVEKVAEAVTEYYK